MPLREMNCFQRVPFFYYYYFRFVLFLFFFYSSRKGQMTNERSCTQQITFCKGQSCGGLRLDAGCSVPSPLPSNPFLVHAATAAIIITVVSIHRSVRETILEGLTTKEAGRIFKREILRDFNANNFQ